MTNGKDKELARLKAENKRLKRLIARTHSGIWGITNTNELANNDNSDENLPLFISSILVSQLPFKERINKVLSALGNFADVSRIYIFENRNNNKNMQNVFEWCNEGVTPQKDFLQDISYEEFPHWKKMLTQDGYIKTSNINTLPEELHNILSSQDIESILVIPLKVHDSFFGFIGFDECIYQREWLPIEFDLLKLASRLIANAYENEINLQQDLKYSQNQKLLLDISRLLVSKLTFSEKIDSCIEKVASHYQLETILIYENSDNHGYCTLKNLFQRKALHRNLTPIQLLNYDKELPAWLSLFKEKGFFCSETSKKEDLSGNAFINHFPDCAISAVPIRSKEVFWGFMVNIGQKQHSCKSFNATAFSTVADMLAGAYEREHANLQLQLYNEEILTINHEIEKKEAFLQNILGSAPVGIVLVRNRKIEYINSSMMQASGYLKEELIGSNISEYYYRDKEDEPKVNAFYQKIDNEGIASDEFTLRGKSGLPLELRVVGKQMPDNQTDMCYLLISEDISLIKTAEKRLEESEIQNKKIVESTIDGIFIFNNDKHITFANKSGLEMLGYTLDELKHIKLDAIFASDIYLTRFLTALENIKNGQEFITELQLINKNNEIIYTEIYGTSIRLKGIQHAYFSLHNISKRKRKEEELRHSEQKFRALTENSPDHIIRIDRTGAISFCNASFLREFLMEEKNCIGKKITEIEGLPTEYAYGLKNAISDVLISKNTTPLELTFRINNQAFAFDWTITPETDDHNNLSSLLLVGRNFTLRKRAEHELIIAKERAESADTLKSAFLANMSHEIRTPLNAIVGFSNLLRESFISDEEKQEYVEIINTSSENLMALINDIIDLAKIESGELSIHIQESNPNAILENLFHVFEKRMDLDSKNHLKFYLQLPENSEQYLVACDLKRINQIFTNLLSNAFKFTPKGFIEMGYTIEENQLRFFVRDTGIGISEDKQSVIFDPFRQAEEDTSKVYGGTGLGLSISKRLLEAMNSQLELTSEKNKGSEFAFALPIKAQKSEPIVKKIPKSAKNVRNTSIPIHHSWPDKIVLLVDATSTAQLQMRKNLESTKITLISARTASSARELLLKRNDIDLVLIDINMPGINPEEFIQNIRQLGIGIPFIAQSTNSSEERNNQLINAGFNDTIDKPIPKDQLLQKINIALQGIHKSQLN
nr:PAS domain S-box protein [uncultured Carboxylicivirga sp.]